ncbi:hypothetical protein ACIRVF_07820 [Kitasatospora sp. NPDC101157]|uniref:hypothetical protein n=1 Tax=Kitasatospora sp. NPDC101157 TaxID=3364098 RepID=UPI003815DF40
MITQPTQRFTPVIYPPIPARVQVLAEVTDLPQWSPRTEDLLADYQLRQALGALVARVPNAVVTEAVVSPDRSAVDLSVASVADLSVWYDTIPQAVTSAASRCERRIDGQLYALGGMQWKVSWSELAGLPGVRLTVSALSGENEELPDTQLVRHLCPYEARLRQIRVREAAVALQMGWVA